MLITYKGRLPRFSLRDNFYEISGLLLIRPDWAEAAWAPPGLMPVIEVVKRRSDNITASNLEDAIERVEDVYDTLRERMEPSKLFVRGKTEWILPAIRLP